jgi:hypothetical protein
MFCAIFNFQTRSRVSTGDECSIIIEDGYVVGQAQAEQPQQKSWKAGVF